ncbi:MAG: glycosyltransferase [Chloroflexi bacterium]|nr:glycosyltransferase [Chloroflexota bacterium]
MISVVVPAFNVAPTLGACLDALHAQTLPRDAYEVIVVDDGSTDATRAVAESRGVRVIAQANAGAGAARNAGAQNARGEIVVFIDADSVPDAGWLAAMARPFADATIAGASGEKKSRQTNLWARLTQLEYDFRYDRMTAHGVIDFVDSSTAAYRRAVLLARGGFDTTLKEAEDTELSFRLAEHGCRMVLVRDAVVYHTHPTALGEFLRRKFHYAIGRATVYARMPRKAARDQRTPTWQKFQPLLALALPPVILGAFVWQPLAWMAFALLAIFFATTLPFARYCWTREPRVALVAPVTLLLIAYAAGAGMFVGVLAARRSSAQVDQ